MSWPQTIRNRQPHFLGSEGGAASPWRDRRVQHRDDSPSSGWDRVPGRSEDKLLHLVRAERPLSLW